MPYTYYIWIIHTAGMLPIITQMSAQIQSARLSAPSRKGKISKRTTQLRALPACLVNHTYFRFAPFPVFYSPKNFSTYYRQTSLWHKSGCLIVFLVWFSLSLSFSLFGEGISRLWGEVILGSRTRWLVPSRRIAFVQNYGNFIVKVGSLTPVSVAMIL